IRPASGLWTPVRTLIKVDFPAPFSPMMAWISPGLRVKSTPSRARTPVKSFVMPVIWTIGSSDIGSYLRCGWADARGRVRGPLRPSDAVSVCVPAALELPVGQFGLELVGGEGGLFDGGELLDVLAVGDLDGEVHQLLAEGRVALDDVVELAVDA